MPSSSRSAAAPLPAESAPGPRTGPDLRAALHNAWTNLPVLLLGSALVSVAVLVTLVAGRAGLLAAAILGLLTVPPPLMALTRVCSDVIDGEDPTLREYLRHLRSLGGGAIGICAVPLLMAGLTVTALLAYDHGGGPFMLLPMGLGATATVLTLLAAVVAVPLRAHCSEPTGMRAWLLALHLFAKAPIPFLAAIVVGGLGISVTVTVSNGLFLLVPAPFSLVLAMAFRTIRPAVHTRAATTCRSAQAHKGA